ncbi:MAG: universal stress protein [Candidatus Bipolaricaulia bacterium]
MRKILVPIAYFAACRRALELAGRLAKIFQADLTVLHVHQPRLRGSPIGIGAMREKLAEWGLETGPFKLLRQAEDSLIELGVVKLDEQINPVQKHALKALTKGLYEVHLLGPHEENIRFRLREGDPVREILKEAKEGDHDLIITGTRDYKGFKKFLVGSIAEEVAFHAPCSILVAKNLQPYQGILVGTDGSPPAREAVRQAGELAKALGTRLKVMAVAEDGREEAEANFEEALEILAPFNLKPEPLLRVGDPLEELVEAAGQDQIIVIGRSERSRMRRFFTSSLPLRLLERAEAPVLIAAPPPAA